MSAEEILEEFNNLFPDSSPPTYDQEEHKDWLRNALAAYTKFLLEKIFQRKNFKSEPNSQGNTRTAGWNAHCDHCRSILQDQIDQLTK